MTTPLLSHGGQLRTISEHYGIPASELMDFSANINPDGPPAGVIAALRSSLDDLSLLTAYPDLEHAVLRHALAQHGAIAEDTVVIANGFVPLLEAALRALRLRNCLLPVPAFVEYRRSLTQAGVHVQLHLLSADADFHYDLPAMERVLSSGAHDAVLLANPQNPSGALASREALLSFVASCARRKITVLLDEAFIDYASAHSLLADVDHLANLIVFRSVTKFYAIPGLRVAYAAANRHQAAALSAHVAPWPVTSLAACAVLAALADHGYAEESRLRNEQRRATLQLGLQHAGVRTYASAANFLLFQLPSSASADAFWERMIVQHRIVLRHCVNYDGLPPRHFRAAVQTPPRNERLVAAVAVCLDKHPPNRRLRHQTDGGEARRL